MDTVDKIFEITRPIAKDLNYQLVDVEYVKEGKNWFLRIFIDQEGGVSLDDCTRMSERLSEVLDTLDPDPIPQAYYLEVSSPGAEQPIQTKEALEQALGEYIHVDLYNQIGPDNRFEGTLKSIDDEKIILTIQVKSQEKDIEISRDNISRARYAVKF